MRAVLLSALLFVCTAFPALSQSREIEGVISSQIEAFKADDFTTAFTYAHPSIRNIFRTPENFGRMVTQGYPMVWRPAEVEYLDLSEQSGRVLQNVRIVDGEGRVFVLEYAMTQTEKGWLISGVRILEQVGLSA